MRNWVETLEFLNEGWQSDNWGDDGVVEAKEEGCGGEGDACNDEHGVDNTWIEVSTSRSRLGQPFTERTSADLTVRNDRPGNAAYAVDLRIRASPVPRTAYGSVSAIDGLLSRAVKA